MSKADKGSKSLGFWKLSIYFCSGQFPPPPELYVYSWFSVIAATEVICTAGGTLVTLNQLITMHKTQHEKHPVE